MSNSIFFYFGVLIFTLSFSQKIIINKLFGYMLASVFFCVSLSKNFFEFLVSVIMCLGFHLFLILLYKDKNDV